ncbi:GyrI-like domain-containing protein [Faecalibacter sp. LW9]|uniref:GyrI-like domain-containing protein n=1 Tax=Faecalibacter sp. LW9 TaxID=3103144 RepID=UPI002AFF5D6C|nr:GyrI-like domain-containing protein [Faecalibacter sp. LW9]
MKQINIVLVFLIMVFVAIPFFLPNQIDEKASYEIEAPIGLVFDQFSDLREFSKWEQFTAADSLTQKKFFGGDEEEEAVEWKSHSSSVGNGKITLKDSDINKSINYNIKYEGWEEEDQMSFMFDQTPSGTTKVDVHYLSQEVPYFYRYFIFFNSPMKKVEESIQLFNDQIKVRLDKERKEGNLIYGEYRIVKLPKQILIAVKKFSKIDNDDDYMKKADEAFEVIYKALVNEEGTFDFDLGFPKIYRTEIDREKDRQTIFAGIGIIEDLPLKGSMQRVIVPEGEYLLSLHQGPRSQKKKTIELMKKYASSKKINLTEREIEVLLNDPKETDTLQLKSRIYIPIKKD